VEDRACRPETVKRQAHPATGCWVPEAAMTPDPPKKGRRGYHDPTYELGGAAPAQSALTLRLVLASFGLVLFGGGAVVLALMKVPAWQVIVLALLAAVALVDVLVIARRKANGEPG
jgi:hypothetical protein